jgi:hypothetical protein
VASAGGVTSAVDHLPGSPHGPRRRPRRAGVSPFRLLWRAKLESWPLTRRPPHESRRMISTAWPPTPSAGASAGPRLSGGPSRRPAMRDDDPQPTDRLPQHRARPPAIPPDTTPTTCAACSTTCGPTTPPPWLPFELSGTPRPPKRPTGSMSCGPSGSSRPPFVPGSTGPPPTPASR